MLAGLSGRGIKPLTWVSAAAAFVGVGLLEGGVTTPSPGDLWQLLSAFAFGVQVGTRKYIIIIVIVILMMIVITV
jgi:hypothetical protein